MTDTTPSVVNGRPAAPPKRVVVNNKASLHNGKHGSLVEHKLPPGIASIGRVAVRMDGMKGDEVAYVAREFLIEEAAPHG